MRFKANRLFLGSLLVDPTQHSGEREFLITYFSDIDKRLFPTVFLAPINEGLLLYSKSRFSYVTARRLTAMQLIVPFKRELSRIALRGVQQIYLCCKETVNL
jgi:hypothetical protein